MRACLCARVCVRVCVCLCVCVCVCARACASRMSVRSSAQRSHGAAACCCNGYKEALHLEQTAAGPNKWNKQRNKEKRVCVRARASMHARV